MKTFKDFESLASTRKRKLSNNTYLIIRDDGGYGVQLHDTEIIIHYPDRVVLDSGGYKTNTTKARINEFTTFNLWQDKGVWFVGGHVFADGMTFFNNGRITGKGEDPKKTRKLRAQVLKYSKDYARAFALGEIPAPSGGDCWPCCMVTDDGQNPMGGPDHILSHIEEKYYVPSMLNRCSKNLLSQAAGWFIADVWAGKNPDDCFSPDLCTQQIARAIRQFCYKELNLAR